MKYVLPLILLYMNYIVQLCKGLKPLRRVQVMEVPDTLPLCEPVRVRCSSTLQMRRKGVELFLPQTDPQRQFIQLWLRQDRGRPFYTTTIMGACASFCGASLDNNNNKENNKKGPLHSLCQLRIEESSKVQSTVRIESSSQFVRYLSLFATYKLAHFTFVPTRLLPFSILLLHAPSAKANEYKQNRESPFSSIPSPTSTS